MSRKADSAEKTTTAEALLGMLSLGAMSGYEIRKTIDDSTGNFWQESYGQIYPTLKRLVVEGLAKVKPERAGAAKRPGPGRTVYELTAAGRKRLRAWLKNPSTPQVPRNELLLKVFFARQGAPGLVREQVGAFRMQKEAELERYRQIRASLLRHYERHPDLPYWLMTLDYGEMECKALVAWCDRTTAIAEKLEEARHAS